MTEQKYYLVTEEELNQIKNDCAFPERFSCEDGCEYWDETDDFLPCTFKGANALMDEVMKRTLEDELKKKCNECDRPDEETCDECADENFDGG